MKTELCERFGIEYPIFVFTPSEKVAAAVTKAGGLGCSGVCVSTTPTTWRTSCSGWTPTPTASPTASTS